MSIDLEASTRTLRNLLYSGATLQSRDKEAIAALLAEVERLAAVIERVKALHVPRHETRVDVEGRYCAEDDQAWPCTTSAALGDRTAGTDVTREGAGASAVTDSGGLQGESGPECHSGSPSPQNGRER